MTAKAKAAVSKSELALLADDSTSDILVALRRELKEIKRVTETQYKTTGAVEGFQTKIADEKDVRVLVTMYASIGVREEGYNNAQLEISKEVTNLQVPVWQLGGNKAEDIRSDIKLRLKVLTVEDRKKELEKLIEEGSKFLTEKDQKKIWLQKMSKHVDLSTLAIEG